MIFGEVIMARSRRKVSYTVERDGLWWAGKKYGWITDPYTQEHDGASLQRWFKTANRAFGCAKAMPSGTVVRRWCLKKGVRYIEEFIKK
jgi:hypothetical protein